MFHKEKPDYNRKQYGFYTIDELVPKDHFLRQVDSKVDFDFIYDLVEDTYSPNNGRPSLDPVMLVKIPQNQVLSYRTTTQEGYREYKSNPKVCFACPLLSVCTQSKNFQKVVTRHVWKDALEFCEEIRHQREMKELYKKRKETIERLFGTAKEYHNLRYTREKGKSKMEDQVGLTLACLNIKKLVKWIGNIPFYFVLNPIFEWNIR